MIYVDDDQSALIGTLACSSTQEESCRGRRLVEAGIDPDTFETLRHEVELAQKIPYLDYLRTLLPQQRREAISDLADPAWGTAIGRPFGPAGNPLFVGHPKLAPELAGLEIRDLTESCYRHVVEPVEFVGGQCIAPIWYRLFGGGYEIGEYYVAVHILAGIGNQPGGGGDIWVQDLWFRIDSVDDPPEDSIPFLVP
jgi:hypothetical protein